MRLRGTPAASPSVVARAVVAGTHRSRGDLARDTGGGHLDGCRGRLCGGRACPSGSDDGRPGATALDGAHPCDDRDHRGRHDLGDLRAARPRATPRVAGRWPVSPRVPLDHVRDLAARRDPHAAGMARRARGRRRDRHVGGPRDLAVPDRQHRPHGRRRSVPALGARVVSADGRRARRLAPVAAADARPPLRVSVVLEHGTRAHARGRPRTERRRSAEP